MERHILEERVNEIVTNMNKDTQMFYLGNLSEETANKLAEETSLVVDEMDESNAEHLPIIYRNRLTKEVLYSLAGFVAASIIGFIAEPQYGPTIGAYSALIIGISRLPKLFDYRGLTTAMRNEFENRIQVSQLEN